MRRSLSATVLGLLFLGFAHGAMAFSANVDIDALIANADFIFVGEILAVTDGSAQAGEPRIATVRVIDSWKGTPGRELKFIASPGWFACDTSNARKGERVVLFLRKERNERQPRIAHFGRGRMPVGRIDETSVAFVYEVTFPKSISVHREKKFPSRAGVSLATLEEYVHKNAS